MYVYIYITIQPLQDKAQLQTTLQNKVLCKRFTKLYTILHTSRQLYNTLQNNTKTRQNKNFKTLQRYAYFETKYYTKTIQIYNTIHNSSKLFKTQTN